MVTQEQALTERYFHYTGKQNCTVTIGTRGGVTEKKIEVRANGKCQTWKTRPLDFRLPIKYGLYEYAYITQDNAHDFHVVTECTPTINDMRV